MLKTRLIPALFLKNGLVVRSECFVDFRELGNPLNQLERLSDWNADELIYVDITRSGPYDLKRDDHRIKNVPDIVGILRQIAERCSMPLTFGGRITTLTQVDDFVANGADKVIVNSGAYRQPELISAVAEKYGRQCMVVGIDVKEQGNRHELYIDNGRTPVPDDPLEYAERVEALGAGEIFLNSIDRDGRAIGYDFDYIKQMARAVSIPVICCGGAGNYADLAEAMAQTGVAAVAAGNIFNFTEDAYSRAKQYLKQKNLPVR